MGPYLIPAHEIETEIIVVNSRFISCIGPVFTPEEARTFVARRRTQYPDASHHVNAFILGHANSLITHSTDDGEPAGTAGRPALSVLQGSGLGDVIVVISRYFGGTKLGTGGLVRAYSDAVRSGLAILPLAQKISTSTLLVALKYTFLERARQLAQQQQGRILDETFMADVTLTIQLPTDQESSFNLSLMNLTAGTAQIKCIETNPETIFPVQ